MSDVNYRWVDGPTATESDWSKIEDILASRGWMSLNRNTSRVLIAERDGVMAFHVFQLVPFCGPLFVPPSMRGTGVAEELADKMLGFLTDIQARGWLVTAESQHAAKLCEERGMERVQSPVYVMVNPGGVEV
jgi:hypothetical protein